MHDHSLLECGLYVLEALAPTILAAANNALRFIWSHCAIAKNLYHLFLVVAHASALFDYEVESVRGFIFISEGDSK